jgi:hypothetical protein
MRTMNCGNVRREIEEASPGGFLSSLAAVHLSNCPECVTFRDQQTRLREIMSSLGTVNAPDDFDFRLRARLAGEKPGSVARFPLTNLSFGFRFAALATMLLMFGATLLLVNMRSSRETSPSATLQTPGTTANAPLAVASTEAASQSSVAEVGRDSALSPAAATNVPRPKSPVRSSALASARDTGRTRTKDMSAAQARVLNSDSKSRASDFEIQGSRQPLKMSLDDGRGSSRTISLPSVSFGSQRVLSQNTSPLVASARGSW